MKRIFISLTFIFSVLSASAGGADDALSAIVARVKALGAYSVDFKLDLQGQSFDGEYAVQGQKYYVNIADGSQEFYGNGVSRYEVARAMQQVVIDTPPTESRTLLDNPTEAFTLLESGKYSARMEGQEIILTPSTGEKLEIVVTPSSRDGLPSMLCYRTDDESVTIKLGRFRNLRGEPKTFDLNTYSDYEIIDLR